MSEIDEALLEGTLGETADRGEVGVTADREEVGVTVSEDAHKLRTEKLKKEANDSKPNESPEMQLFQCNENIKALSDEDAPNAENIEKGNKQMLHGNHIQKSVEDMVNTQSPNNINEKECLEVRETDIAQTRDGERVNGEDSLIYMATPGSLFEEPNLPSSDKPLVSIAKYSTFIKNSSLAQRHELFVELRPLLW
ncbi:hypothetical protein GDO86_002038 [Hymenochirus boettgeri]|uniref:Uncharacterized protein n=1 Tax=Hymenochirus boettgeri TaxID=247094 RepID=A0A8T2KF84_9PIPI|nr:hypothetical protein GDO86_002038 [Hymenochirus boettgeri]